MTANQPSLIYRERGINALVDLTEDSTMEHALTWYEALEPFRKGISEAELDRLIPELAVIYDTTCGRIVQQLDALASPHPRRPLAG